MTTAITRSKIRVTKLDLVVFLLLLGGVGWILLRVNAQVNYKWNWPVLPQYIFRFDEETARWVPGLIMQGVITTLRLSIWSTLLAFIFGIVMGLFRTGTNRFRKLIGWSYVEVIRNIPVLVWIFIFYYFISDQLIQYIRVDEIMVSAPEAVQSFLTLLFAAPAHLPLFISGIIALAVYEGAYVTEIIRAGIQSLEKGQWEASAALGMTRRQQMRHVIFPQAFRRILPPLAGQFISTIKDSAIVSVISIQELTFQGMELMAATFMTFEIWITIMVLYFILCLACSLSVERLELFLERKTA
jgi:polar amino acid transport system permease protein